jgi:hypothetical protein
MRDYSTGKIYAIRSPSTDKVYIGSTIEKLSSRMAKHRCDYKGYLNGKRNYITSFELLKLSDAYIELLEDYTCERKEQLDRREGEVMRETENCVNARIAGRNKKQYCDEHKNDKREYDKIYRENNKQTIAAKKRIYRENNKKAIAARIKIWCKNNKDKIKQKFDCPCGGRYTHQNKAKHLKTTKHFQYTLQFFPFC